MQRDYEYSAATRASDLLLAEEVGFLAAKRAASRLNSKKIKSCTLDVIFEPRVAKAFCHHSALVLQEHLLLEEQVF